LLKSQCRSAIQQVQGWGDWASTDERKEQLLKSGCKIAIEQVQGWSAWANTDARKEQLLKSYCFSAIEQVQEWAIWANTDARKEQLLKSRCNGAIEQVQGWGGWANTVARIDLVMRTSCAYAMNQVRQANVLKISLNHNTSSLMPEDVTCSGSHTPSGSLAVSQIGLFASNEGSSRVRSLREAGLSDSSNQGANKRSRF